MNTLVNGRGRKWFQALTGADSAMDGDPASVLSADAKVGSEIARFLCVVPDPNARFARARHGEVGLEEAYALATRVREVIEEDKTGDKRPIVAIVDVKSQAYGRLEEIAAIFLAGATACDAYATARMGGHPVVSLIVGHAISGGFLTHGYQANRILAFDDAGVMIHAMHKEAAARITRRSVKELEELGKKIAPMSYDVRDFAKLGMLHKLIHVENADEPQIEEIAAVQQELWAAIEDARKGPCDLSNRLHSKEALQTRKASILVRRKLEEQWREC
ncbi:MAG: biotin-independent malonate decarboxylase subunit gamma [Candidatus Melainabacteria bacterium]|mgnify:CR=1 FL=1|nr:biotin-independent malonate decarboxylase subunit gamma [Candidatus Melainabacteria bacterium]